MVGDAVVEQEGLYALQHKLAVVIVTRSAEVLVKKTRVHIGD